MENELYKQTVRRLARMGVIDPTSQIIALAEEIERYREKIRGLEGLLSASGIFKNIDRGDFTLEEKGRAAQIVMDSATHNTITNADRIRAMSDEELEAFLVDVDLDRAELPFISNWGEWLRQPAEG